MLQRILLVNFLFVACGAVAQTSLPFTIFKPATLPSSFTYSGFAQYPEPQIVSIQSSYVYVHTLYGLKQTNYFKLPIRGSSSAKDFCIAQSKWIIHRTDQVFELFSLRNGSPIDKVSCPGIREMKLSPDESILMLKKKEYVLFYDLNKRVLFPDSLKIAKGLSTYDLTTDNKLLVYTQLASGKDYIKVTTLSGQELTSKRINIDRFKFNPANSRYVLVSGERHLQFGSVNIDSNRQVTIRDSADIKFDSCLFVKSISPDLKYMVAKRSRWSLDDVILLGEESGITDSVKLEAFNDSLFAQADRYFSIYDLQHLSIVDTFSQRETYSKDWNFVPGTHLLLMPYRLPAQKEGPFFLYDADTKKSSAIKSLGAAGIKAFAFAAKAKKLIAVNSENSIKIFDSQNGREWFFPAIDTAPLNDLRLDAFVTRDQQYLVQYNYKYARVWRLDQLDSTPVSLTPATSFFNMWSGDSPGIIFIESYDQIEQYDLKKLKAETIYRKGPADNTLEEFGSINDSVLYQLSSFHINRALFPKFPFLKREYQQRISSGYPLPEFPAPESDTAEWFKRMTLFKARTGKKLFEVCDTFYSKLRDTTIRLELSFPSFLREVDKISLFIDSRVRIEFDPETFRVQRKDTFQFHPTGNWKKDSMRMMDDPLFRQIIEIGSNTFSMWSSGYERIPEVCVVGLGAAKGKAGKMPEASSAVSFLVNQDKNLVISDRNTTLPILQLSLFNGFDNWAVNAPNGCFDANHSVLENLYWQDSSGSLLPFEQFYSAFYYPGLVAAGLNGFSSSFEGFSGQSMIQVPDLELLMETGGAEIREVDKKYFFCIKKASERLLKRMAAIRNSSVPAAKTGDDCAASFPATPELVTRMQKRAGAGFPVFDSSYNAQAPGGTLHVACIGIGRYPATSGIKSLPYIDTSIKQFQQLFAPGPDFGAYYDSINMWTPLMDSFATSSGIYEYLSYIDKRVKPADVLVLYFAAHGIIPSESEVFYFLPYNAVYDQQLLNRSQCYNTTHLVEFVKKLQARKVLILIDACQSGGALTSLGKVVKAQRESVSESLTPPSVNVIASSTSLQFAEQFNGGTYFIGMLKQAFQHPQANISGRFTLHDLFNQLLAASKISSSNQSPLFYWSGVDVPLFKKQ